MSEEEAPYKIVKEGFPNNWNNTCGEIWTHSDVACNVCGKVATCLLMDGSEGEFFNGAICKECCIKAFDL